MFIHNIDPVLLELGPFQVRYYGLAWALGFLFIYFFIKNVAKKGIIKNFDLRSFETFSIYLFLGILVGARLWHVLTAFGYYLANPLQILAVWGGGLAFHGGLAGAIVAGLIFSKKYSINFYELADAVVIPIPVALFLGRLANFTNAEHAGTITSLPWCVQFPAAEGCRHPSQLYEAFKDLFLFFVLFGIYKKKQLKSRPGILFWLFVALYGALRFLVDFFRDKGTDPVILSLSQGQFFSLLMAVVGAWFLVSLHKRKG